MREVTECRVYLKPLNVWAYFQKVKALHMGIFLFYLKEHNPKVKSYISKQLYIEAIINIST